jgi:hypothetical protein
MQRVGGEEMHDHDPCPMCGKPRGYLMETHHEMPGLLDRLRGVNGEADRWVLTGILSVLAALALIATDAVLHVS